jgi:hypothetical protein
MPGGAGQPQYPPQLPYGQQPYPPGQPPYNPQGPYPPPGLLPHGPQHGQPRRKSWLARHKILTGLGGFVALIILGSAASAASGGNHPSVPAAASSAVTSAAASPSAAAAAAAPASPDCNSQAISWWDNGGRSQLAAIGAEPPGRAWRDDAATAGRGVRDLVGA